MGRLLLVVLLTLLGAAALAGCTSSVAPPVTPPSRAASARAEAQVLLARALLPAGARRAAATRPEATGVSPTSAVDLHEGFWVRAVPPAASLTPPGAELTVIGRSSLGLVRWYTISFPATAAEPTRQLVYGFWTGPKEGFTLRLDAQVIWRPSTPRAAFVAPGAAAIVVTSRGVGTHRVTAPSAIAEITRLVDGMQLLPVGGVTSCPADTGGRVALTFDARPTTPPGVEGGLLPWGRPYAFVVLDTTGCPTAQVTQIASSGARTTVRGLDPGGAASQVVALAGLRLPRT